MCCNLWKYKSLKTEEDLYEVVGLDKILITEYTDKKAKENAEKII